MRALANPPTPTVISPIITVAVPSGDIAVTVPLNQVIEDCSRKSSMPSVTRVRDAMDDKLIADPDGVEGHQIRCLIGAARNRVAVGAGRGVVEAGHHCFLDRGRDDVLPLSGFLMGISPGEPENVGEEALGEAVATHDRFGEVHAFGGERDLPSSFDQAFALESLDHLADGGAADVHAFSDAGLDDIDAVLFEFVDRLAVLLDAGCHRGIRTRSCAHSSGL